MNSREYVPNRKLLALARELELLNTELIRLGLSDQARILRLRMYATTSMHAQHHASLQGVKMSAELDDETDNHLWIATFGTKHLGQFKTPREAHAAYRQAHLDHHGSNSEFHPDYTEAEYCADEHLPEGVSITSSSTYLARITLPTGTSTHTQRLGCFKTIDDAHAAHRQAHIEHYGTASKYFGAPHD